MTLRIHWTRRCVVRCVTMGEPACLLARRSWGVKAPQTPCPRALSDALLPDPLVTL